MILESPLGLVTPRVAHHIEKALHDAAQKAHREGFEIPADVADFVADVRRLAEWYRSQRSGSISARAEIAGATPGNPVTLTAGDVGAALGVSPRRVRQMAAAGEIPGETDADGLWVFDAEEIERFADGR